MGWGMKKPTLNLTPLPFLVEIEVSFLTINKNNPPPFFSFFKTLNIFYIIFLLKYYYFFMIFLIVSISLHTVCLLFFSFILEKHKEIKNKNKNLNAKCIVIVSIYIVYWSTHINDV